MSGDNTDPLIAVSDMISAALCSHGLELLGVKQVEGASYINLIWRNAAIFVTVEIGGQDELEDAEVQVLDELDAEAANKVPVTKTRLRVEDNIGGTKWIELDEADLPEALRRMSPTEREKLCRLVVWSNMPTEKS